MITDKKRVSIRALLATALPVAVVGFIILSNSMAAVNGISAEAESGSMGGGAQSTANGTASGGSAARFADNPSSGTSVLAYGAVGNGITDDSTALQTALDSGNNIIIPAGYTFRHTRVLYVNRPNISISGQGTLLATAEATSSFYIRSNNVTVNNVTFKATGITQRWMAPEQHKVVGLHISGLTLTNIKVDGSAGAGIYLEDVSNYTVTDVNVKDSWADGIHQTGGSNNGQVIRPVVTNPGDDGVAVVSYQADGSKCHHITIQSPKVYGQTWGRGISIVGGDNVTYRDIYVERSAGAAIYIATESSYNTYEVTNSLVDGGTVVDSNQNATIVHGAILLSNQGTGLTNSDVTVRNITITNTAASAQRNLAILGTPQARLTLENITITGGPSQTYAVDVPTSVYRSINVVHNGTRLTDVNGW